ncbi:MAG: FkbM family methyltransferase [Chloroflexi bacterium]|nr:FkbM family methyltransferase [Chloroflexota bacterium]
MNAISTFGLPELPEMAFLLHALQPSDVFVDVGANVGAFTLLASGVIGARTIAVEPITSTVQELHTNLQLNGLQDSVTIVPVAVGDKTATVRMEMNRDVTNRVVSTDAITDTIEVKSTTLDEIVPTGSRSLVVKIDVEGYETPVIKGAHHLLESGAVRALIVETMGQGARYGYKENELHEYLLSIGYNSCEYDPINRCLIQNAPYQPFAKQYVTDSTIYVLDFAEVSERVKLSSRYHIHGIGTDI